MKKIKYTPDAADKLRELKKTIHIQYGEKKAKQIVGQITKVIRNLADNEMLGPSVENLLGIEIDYRYIFVSRNYVFYSVEEDCIRIINIYNEREDFMWLLFGIETTSEETKRYWRE